MVEGMDKQALGVLDDEDSTSQCTCRVCGRSIPCIQSTDYPHELIRN
jgi:hypothetical protein